MLICKRSNILFSFLILMAVPLAAYAGDIQKSQFVGGSWSYKKFYYVFNEDGTFTKELRLRGKTVVSSCTGKYEIEKNTIYLKNCPDLGGKENLEVIPESVTNKSFKAYRVSFGVQLPPGGSKSRQPLVFKRD